jgi:hypothetical protein
MSDLELEVVPETGENTDSGHHYYVDQVELPELRRYICLDMARMMAVLPEKTVNVGYIGHVDRRTPPTVTQAHPGAPIYLRQGSDEPLLISDSAALLLASRLITFVLGNMQALVRANADRA